MHPAPAVNVTGLLLAWNGGDDQALDHLTPLVYDHLHQLARRYLAGERPGHLLQVTALVNEAYVRLVDSHRVDWQNRAHFFAVSAQLMRRILVDFARARGSLKRGQGQQTSLDEALAISPQSDPDLVALDDALQTLAQMDPRKARVVEMKFFGGLKENEIAEVLGVSIDTVQRDWKAAKAWLYGELQR